MTRLNQWFALKISKWCCLLKASHLFGDVLFFFWHWTLFFWDFAILVKKIHHFSRRRWRHEDVLSLSSFKRAFIWMFPKNSGFSPQIIYFNRGFPLFSPSILGVFPLFLDFHPKKPSSYPPAYPLLKVPAPFQSIDISESKLPWVWWDMWSFRFLVGG